MAVYTVTAPDGTEFEVTAPDDATEGQVLEYAKAQWAAQAKGTPLDILRAQLGDPARDPASTPELLREIARREAAGAQPTQSPMSVPAASQADVRKAEPKPTPMQDQADREERFHQARLAYVQATGGVIPPGGTLDDAVEKWSGIKAPERTQQQAELDQLRQTGQLVYGNSVPYQAAKAAAGIGGFAFGGPAGATAAEAPVRYAALASNLKKAVDAGAITQDRAAEIMLNEMANGTAEDTLWNFGVPLLGEVIGKIPGARWLGGKVASLLGGRVKLSGLDADLVAQRQRALDKLAGKATTPEGKAAVQELGQRVPDALPTPGQVTGQAPVSESAARVTHPEVFEKARQKLENAAGDMRTELVTPAAQPSRQALGEQITQLAENTQKAVKNRLRPTFEEANRLGVSIDLSGVKQIAEDALARNGKVPGGQLKPGEIAKLRQIVDDLNVPAQPAGAPTPSTMLGPNGKPAFMTPGSPAVPAGTRKVDAEAALDFLSARKADTRAVTADGVPSTPFVNLLNQMISKGEGAYQTAAQSAGRGDVVQKLMQARKDYGGVMDTVYEDAVKAALKKDPEQIGHYLWQAGSVSRLQQTQKLMQIAQREGTMSAQGAADTSRALVRGFLQEAVPDVNAAAKWSENLNAKPGLRDTWNELTSAPGGHELRNAMSVLEQASQMATRTTQQLTGTVGLSIPLRRAAGLGLGVSYVTGVIHPGMAVTGFAIDGLAHAMAVAYTQGNKGMLNLLSRALRANSVGTAAGIQAVQAALPEIEKFAAANGIDNIFVGEQSGR